MICSSARWLKERFSDNSGRVDRSGVGVWTFDFGLGDSRSGLSGVEGGVESAGVKVRASISFQFCILSGESGQAGLLVVPSTDVDKGELERGLSGFWAEWFSSEDIISLLCHARRKINNSRRKAAVIFLVPGDSGTELCLHHCLSNA